MNQITTRYITEGDACYEQYVISDPAAKTELAITPERGGMITGFTLDGDEYIWTRRPNFSECSRPRFGVPVLFPNCGGPDGGVHMFDGKAYPMENHGLADLCAWDVESVGPDGVTLVLESTPLTKFLYPFDFTLLVTYNLVGNKATISPSASAITPISWLPSWKMWTSTSTAPPAPRAPRVSSPPHRKRSPSPARKVPTTASAC